MIDAMAAIPPSFEAAAFIDWTFVTAGVAGFAAGTLYRAAALIILSAACAATALISSFVHGWSLWQGLLTAAGLVASLQLGYLGGVGLTLLTKKLKAKTGTRSIYAALFKRDPARSERRF
jgi:hypothetical protein